MKERWIHVAIGIVFDVLALIYGVWAALGACFAHYSGTLEQFWFLRLTLSTLPVSLMAIAFTLLHHDGALRFWSHFVVFECLIFLMLVSELEHVWPGIHDHSHAAIADQLLALLVDAAAYGGVRTVCQAMRRRRRLT